MPGRVVPLVNAQTYHVFNRGINHQPTFIDKFEYRRAIQVLDFYRFSKPPMKLSRFLILPTDERLNVQNFLKVKGDKLVEILAYCIMPNHFHFVLKQLRDKGISKFLANFQNSYTRYFNIKRERDGSLFLDQFKAVLILTDEQLLHVSRYVHLNPLTSFVVKDFDDLVKYKWSSLAEYLNDRLDVCDLSILSFFKLPSGYKRFLEDQVGYQRELHRIQHLILE